MSQTARNLAWDDFRLIKAIADTRALAPAAARLGMDHSTVFRRLRGIEAMLGIALFERHRSGYSLTAAGEEVSALADRVDADITEVTRRLAGLDAAPSGLLRIATSDTLLTHLLMPLLPEFCRRHPAIRLELLLGNTALNLSRRDADIALRATEAPPDTLVGRRIGRIAWALYARRDMAPSPDPLWVGPGEGLTALGPLRYLERHVPPDRIACRLSTVQALAEAVEAGLGQGHLPCFLADTRPALRRLAPPEPDFAADLWLLTHPDLRQAPRVRAAMEFFAAGLSEGRARIEGKRAMEGEPAI